MRGIIYRLAVAVKDAGERWGIRSLKMLGIKLRDGVLR